MKAGHLAFLASDTWAQMLRADLLPWLTDNGDLGDDVLEIGPGPGRTTDLLRERAAHVTALELDASLAGALAARLTGSNVEVLQGDGTDTGLRADRFRRSLASMCFTTCRLVSCRTVSSPRCAECCVLAAHSSSPTRSTRTWSGRGMRTKAKHSSRSTPQRLEIDCATPASQSQRSSWASTRSFFGRKRALWSEDPPRARLRCDSEWCAEPRSTSSEVRKGMARRNCARLRHPPVTCCILERE